MWLPRFIHYHLPLATPPGQQQQPPLNKQQQVLQPSSITNILPRMQRLGGPFGMYGTVYGLSTAVVHIAHPIPARAVLMGTMSSSNSNNNKSNANTSRQRRSTPIATSCGAIKQPFYNNFKNFFGHGVFTADGDEWREKRASVIHALFKGNNNSGASLLEKEANQAANQIIQELKTATKTTTNIVPILQRGTIGLIYRYLTHDYKGWKTMAVPITSQQQEQSPQQQHLDEDVDSLSSSSSSSITESEAMPESKRHQQVSSSTTTTTNVLLQSYLYSVTVIRMILLAQGRSLWWFLPQWCYRAFSALYRQEEATMVAIRKFAHNTIASAQPGSPLDVLQQRSSHDTTKDVLDEAITLLFAGQDTSAATLSWTLHLLSLHPEIQDELAKEVKSVLVDDSNDDVVLTKRLVSKMPYLDAVIKEAMRLYPVAPFVLRSLPHDVQVVVGDDKQNAPSVTTLRKGAMACIWIYGLHRNQDLWDRPNDFWPQRWLVGQANQDTGMTTGAYMPFAAGPRNCVGQPLAHVILRVVLAKLVHRYRFVDDRLDKTSGHDVSKLLKEMQPGFTVLPEGGVQLRIEERDQDG